jgi:hypothetical protein
MPTDKRLRIRPMLFMVLSIACATFFFFLFYVNYWQWIPLYKLFGQTPVFLFFYQDIHALLIIPVVAFLVAAHHFYRQFQSINR